MSASLYQALAAMLTLISIPAVQTRIFPRSGSLSPGFGFGSVLCPKVKSTEGLGLSLRGGCAQEIVDIRTHPDCCCAACILKERGELSLAFAPPCVHRPLFLRSPPTETPCCELMKHQLFSSQLLISSLRFCTSMSMPKYLTRGESCRFPSVASTHVD